MAALNADREVLQVQYATTHARHDPTTCLAPGLFRALKRGARGKLDVTYEFGAHRTVRFRGPDALGADDLRVLQFLVAAGGPRGRGAVIGTAPKSAIGDALRSALELKGEAASTALVQIRTSRREILRELGVAWSAPQGKAVVDSIARLAAVTLQVRSYDTEVSSGKGLLSFAIDHPTGQIVVALNFMLSAAVLGDASRYVWIPMDEVRGLKSDAARLIHQRLCAWINPGATGRIAFDTMAEYVYPVPISDRRSRSKRCASIRRALDEFSVIGWSLAPAGGCVIAVGRPQTTRWVATGDKAGKNRRRRG